MKIINLIFLSYCILEIFPLDNGLGKTPQMGWNTWNKYGCNINSELIEKSITFLANSELNDAGYRYINLDDCWQEEERDSTTNKIVPDRNRFPKDIKMLSGSAHRNNLYLGLYSDAGTKTCAGKAGSLGYEDIDAKTYAEWEIDYLKYDNCYNENKPAKERYTVMRDALKNSNRQIFYSICNWGEEDIPQWGKDVGNSWRTTGDISDMWLSMLRIIDIKDQYHQYAGPGGWNDPDMLEVGNGKLTEDENIAHFSLWCMMAAPLMLGNDIRKLLDGNGDPVQNSATLKILTNKQLIAIDQDTLCKPAKRVAKSGGVDILARPLSNGDVALCLFNGKGSSGTARFNLDALTEDEYLDFGKVSAYEIHDLWTDERTVTSNLNISVPKHSVKVYRVKTI